MSPRYRMPRRSYGSTYRRRGRRPRLGETLLNAAVYAGLTFAVLTTLTAVRGHVAALLAVFAAGISVGIRLRVPYIHMGWRRMR